MTGSKTNTEYIKKQIQIKDTNTNTKWDPISNVHVSENKWLAGSNANTTHKKTENTNTNIDTNTNTKTKLIEKTWENQ